MNSVPDLLQLWSNEYRLQTGLDADVEQALVSARLQWIDHMDSWLEHSATSPHLRAAPPEPDEELPEPETEIEMALTLGLSTVISVSQWTKFVGRCDIDLVRRRIATVAIALERFAAGHGGAFPESLDELRPKYLDALPVDPFTGSTVSYSPKADGYRLAASDAAVAAWDVENRDPVLDWSKPRN